MYLASAYEFLFADPNSSQPQTADVTSRPYADEVLSWLLEALKTLYTLLNMKISASMRLISFFIWLSAFYMMVNLGLKVLRWYATAILIPFLSDPIRIISIVLEPVWNAFHICSGWLGK